MKLLALVKVKLIKLALKIKKDAVPLSDQVKGDYR